MRLPYTIVVLGVGALGKRHLSSLLNSSYALEVYCYDVNQNTLEGFSWQNMFENKTLATARKIEELPKTIDFAIFSMTAKGRRETFDQLVEHSDVKNILFEKVLFQSLKDYDYVGGRLKKLGIHAWVNCARRQMDCYQSLKEKLQNVSEMRITITGSEWGMACNAIHMLDLIAFLANSSDMVIKNMDLLPAIFDSKREGYKEVFGTIRGTCGKCTGFEITCLQGRQVGTAILISTNKMQYFIMETKNVMIEFPTRDETGYNVSDFIIPYQSQMTQYVMEDILRDSQCKLTEYDESAKLHKLFIRPLIEFFNHNGVEGKTCPIT